MKDEKLHSLISLEDFKAILGIDDRDDRLSRSCLETATKTIEQYCKRYLLRKKHFEWNGYDGDLLIPLREYPVSKVLAVYLIGNGELLEPDFYNVIPDCGTDYDLPFSFLFLVQYKDKAGFTQSRWCIGLDTATGLFRLIYPRLVWNWQAGT